MRDHLGATALLSRNSIKIAPLVDYVALEDAAMGFQEMMSGASSLKVMLVREAASDAGAGTAMPIMPRIPIVKASSAGRRPDSHR